MGSTTILQSYNVLFLQSYVFWPKSIPKHLRREFVAEPWRWETPPDPSKSRTVSGKRKVDFVMPCPPVPMCPPETRVTANYDVGLAHNEHGKEILHLKSSVVSHDVPYGDHFSIEETWFCLRLFFILGFAFYETFLGLFFYFLGFSLANPRKRSRCCERAMVCW